jgi:hypothetical protein
MSQSMIEDRVVVEYTSDCEVHEIYGMYKFRSASDMASRLAAKFMTNNRNMNLVVKKMGDGVILHDKDNTAKVARSFEIKKVRLVASQGEYRPLTDI